jgi:hypothetical protein
LVKIKTTPSHSYLCSSSFPVLPPGGRTAWLVDSVVVRFMKNMLVSDRKKKVFDYFCFFFKIQTLSIFDFWSKSKQPQSLLSLLVFFSCLTTRRSYRLVGCPFHEKHVFLVSDPKKKVFDHF